MSRRLTATRTIPVPIVGWYTGTLTGIKHNHQCPRCGGADFRALIYLYHGHLYRLLDQADETAWELNLAGKISEDEQAR